MKRAPKSFEIALSAVSCAFAAAGLTLGSYVHQLLALGYLVAVFSLMIPLAKGFPLGALLAHVAAVLLAFFASAFGIFTLLPYALFFGLHPILNYLQKKFVHKFPLHVVVFLGKALLFDGALLLMWFTLGELLGFSQASWYPFAAQYLYLVVFLGGTLLFALYDFMIFLCQRSADLAMRRIGR